MRLILCAVAVMVVSGEASAGIIADSRTEWSESGTQGEDNWYYGYRNFTVDGGDLNYNPEDMILFEQDDWRGTTWWLSDVHPPWTSIGKETSHPNGVNNGEEHWTIRRWSADDLTETTPLALTWHVRAQNLRGTGTTGGVYINGAPVDIEAIEGGDDVGVTRTYYANVTPGDKIDLILTPVGPDGSLSDRSDGSALWLLINGDIPPNPTQPDGSPFIPATPGGMEGDVNRDWVVDAADIDLLFNSFDSSDPVFDLTLDSIIDQLDVDFLVRTVLETEFGDVNLDGLIDIEDFGFVFGNYGHADVGWADGDLNGDNVIDIEDFGFVFGNYGFGTTPALAAAINSDVVVVPEPSTSILAAMALLGVGFVVRRRKRAA